MYGITSIELVPGVGNREVASTLHQLLRKSASLRAVVAYWCVGTKELGRELVDRLSGQGFLCVDIHLPTDIDRLAQLVAAGANVYLYLLNPNPQPGELKMRVPPHLLHSKMLLFDFDSPLSELWVGSHNWTARALTGVNVESSLRVLLDRTSDLYNHAETSLEDIRRGCEPFDLAAVEYYKWLQGSALGEPVWVVELRGSHSMLGANQKVTVFGASEDDYRNLKSVDKSIVVSLLDEAAGQEFLYEASITDTGRLPRAGVDFHPRLYAAHDGSARPELHGPEIPPQHVYSAAKSWATVVLVEELSGETLELPPIDRWIPVQDSFPEIPRLPELRKWFRRPERPLVQRPVPRDLFEGRYAVDNNRPATLDSRQSLLRRKLVRAKRISGEIFTLSKGRSPRDEEE